MSTSAVGQTVAGMLDKAHQDRVLENRHYIKTVAEVLRLRARKILLKGVRMKKLVILTGNFLEILNPIAKHDKIVSARLHGAQNAKYTHSSSVQNALISIIGDLILNDIKEEILHAEFYSNYL